MGPCFVASRIPVHPSAGWGACTMKKISFLNEAFLRVIKSFINHKQDMHRQSFSGTKFLRMR